MATETNEQKKLEQLAEKGNSEKEAKRNLVRTLPFEEGHEAYEHFEIRIVKLATDYLAMCQYRLKPGFEAQAQKPGTGSYKSPLEMAAQQRNISL